MTIAPVMAVSMTDEQRVAFYLQMSAVQKDEVVGIMLALLLGTFGAHRFYLGEYGLACCTFSFSGLASRRCSA